MWDDGTEDEDSGTVVGTDFQMALSSVLERWESKRFVRSQAERWWFKEIQPFCPVSWKKESLRVPSYEVCQHTKLVTCVMNKPLLTPTLDLPVLGTVFRSRRPFSSPETEMYFHNSREIRWRRPFLGESFRRVTLNQWFYPETIKNLSSSYLTVSMKKEREEDS